MNDAREGEEGTTETAAATTTSMVPLSMMFRFYEPFDVALLVAGMVFSARRRVGRTHARKPAGQHGGRGRRLQINAAVVAMEVVALLLGTSLTLGYWLMSGGSARREISACVKSMLAQDIVSLRVKRRESRDAHGATANDFQMGMSKKFAELIQSCFSMAGGFGVALLNAQLSGIILSTVPLLASRRTFSSRRFRSAKGK